MEYAAQNNCNSLKHSDFLRSKCPGPPFVTKLSQA
jgi:hypothetical protein